MLYCLHGTKKLLKKGRSLLCIFLILTPFTLFAQNGEIYAVCVGVSQYENTKLNLHSCRRDAVEMYNLLALKTKEENLVLLVDAQATHKSIFSHANRLFAKAKEDDIVLFYFSGHGNDGCFLAYDKILHFKSVQDFFKKTTSTRKLIFADACHSGTLRGSSNRNNSQNQNVGQNVLLFLSSRSEQQSIDDTKLRNGMFTFFLLAGLKGGADSNKDRVITAQELFDFVNPKVKERSKGIQTPVMWGKFDENMEIIRWTQ